MGKTDLKKALPSYRATAGVFDVVAVPEMRYLAVDGHGDPNVSPDHADALAALYPVAYAMKSASEEQLGHDYVVPPLEGLWWADDLASFTTARDKTRWHWTLLLAVPHWVQPSMFPAALEGVRTKRRPRRLDDLRLEPLTEGLCVQTLHVGPYDDEADVLAQLHDEVIPGRGWRPVGKHHEVYLSDPRRTAPARLRTILRQPVRPLTP